MNPESEPPTLIGKCQNRFTQYATCGKSVLSDENYEHTQDGVLLCECCVDGWLRLRTVKYDPEDLRTLEHVNIGKSSRRSAPSSLALPRTVEREEAA